MDLDEEFPPGTLRLEDLHTSSNKAQVILNPTPSDDPNDPLNWSTWRKTVNFALANYFTIMTFVLVDIGVVAYGPYGDLGISYNTINNAWALNYAGLAVGCILFIPFVYRYGRRPVYIFSILFQMASTIWNAKLSTGGALLGAYTLAGVGGAISETIVQITIADLFFVHQRATANGIFIASQTIGSYVGPIVAGYIIDSEGWRWMWWWAAIFLGVNFVLVVFFFEESTYIPTIMGECTTAPPEDNSNPKDQHAESVQAKQLKYADGPGDIANLESAETPSSVEQQSIYKPKTYAQRMALITRPPSMPGDFKRHFYEPFIILATFPGVLYAALTYGALLSWYSVLSTVESEWFLDPPYNWNSSQIGLFNLAPFIGQMIGAVIGGPMNDWAIMWMAKRNNGVYEPEMRLWMSLPTIILCPVGILMFGIGLAHGMSWVLIAFGWGINSVAMAMAMDVALTYVTDSYQNIIGTAIVGVVFVRNGISIIIMFVVTPWIDNLGIQNCLISVAVLSFVLQLLPIPLLKWGKQIRIKKTAAYREMANRQPSRRSE